jgi:hypothetical protein
MFARNETDTRGTRLRRSCRLASADCTSDWQGLGQRDGRLGAQPQAEAYAARCGGQADVARYTEGYRAGFQERPVPNW